MASTPTRLMTFAEFERLPDREGRQELRHGAAIEMAPPKMDHARVQRQLRRLLENAVGKMGVVDKEIGFQLGAANFRVADIAVVSEERWNAARDYIQGAPELVIEVLSSSNTVAEMNDKERLCLENGCREFWTVDLDLRQVKVATPDGHAISYRSGSDIPLLFAADKTLSVDAIFASVAD